MDEGALRLHKEWLAEMAEAPGIPLWPRGETPRWNAEYGQTEPSIVPFLLEKGDKPRGAVIVCPGGGYEFKAPHEGRPIARWLNDAGINAFVLDYRIAPYTTDCALLDAQRAIRTVRHRSAEWGIDPDKIGILGFSAGGHLTIMASTHYDMGDKQAQDPVERVSCRPDAQIPCYPLVSFKPICRNVKARPWLEALLGAEKLEETIEYTAGDRNVSKQTPPAFLWGTGEDFLLNQWPPYIKALQRSKVPFAYHLFPHGPHGMGLAADNPLARQWPALCAAWLKELGF